MNPRVREVTTLADFHLSLIFTNGEKGTYDCSKLFEFGLFKELKKKYHFKQAQVIDGTVVVWPHEQDIYPDTLYLDSVKSHVVHQSN